MEIVNFALYHDTTNQKENSTENSKENIPPPVNGAKDKKRNKMEEEISENNPKKVKLNKDPTSQGKMEEEENNSDR
jgi:hypothetical protein